MRRAVHLPQAGVERVGRAGIHREIDRARLRVSEQHPIPRLAAVARAEDASLLGGRIRVAEHRRIDEVRVLRVDANARDGHRVGQPDVGPRLPAVGCPVDAVALDDIAPQLHFAHPDVDDIRIRLRDRHGADRRRLQKGVGGRAPRGAAVGRLPEAAAGRAEVVLERPARAARHGDRAPAAIRADAPPFQAAEHRLLEWGGTSGLLGVGAISGPEPEDEQRGGDGGRPAWPSSVHRRSPPARI